MKSPLISFGCLDAWIFDRSSAQAPQDFIWSVHFIMSIKQSLCAFIACIILATPAFTQQNLMPSGPTESAAMSEVAAPDPQPGRMSGTATDVNDDIIPGANVILDGPAPEEKRTVVAND